MPMMCKCKTLESLPSIAEAVITKNIIKLIQVLDDGENPNVYFGSGLETPLHRACNLGSSNMVRILIDRGANVNAYDVYRNTPLHLAASRGYTNIVEHLIDADADPSFTNIWDQTPIYRAALGGHASVVNALLLANDTSGYQSNHDGESALTIAAEREHYHVLEKFLNPHFDGWKKRNKQLHLTLIKAALKGNLRMVLLLLERGAPVNYANFQTSLTPLSGAIINGSLQIAKMFIALGADLNVGDEMGDKPLIQAAKKGHWAIFNEILRTGADLKDLSQAWILACEANNIEMCTFISRKFKLLCFEQSETISFRANVMKKKRSPTKDI
nr:ankyrin repeat domain protein 17 [Hymenolepis microstoma]